MRLGKLLNKALQLSCEDLAAEMGLSYDDSVRFKQNAERHQTQQVRQLNLKRGVAPHSDRGTKQTRKKRRSCPIFRLLHTRQITAQEYAAAAAITRGYKLKCGDVSIRQFRYEESRSKAWTDYEAFSDVVAQVRYSHWVRDIKRAHVSFDLCRDVIIEGMPLREAEHQHSLKHGTSGALIKRALELYTRLPSVPHLDHPAVDKG